MALSDAYPEGFSEVDILFECPECSKSMGIDRRGAGLVVRCPDCGTRMRVPVPDLPGEVSAYAGTDVGVVSGLSENTDPAIEEEVHRLEVSLEELHRRRDYLERQRFSTEQHIERLREEMAVIQAALDRMVDILQDIVPAAASDDANG